MNHFIRQESRGAKELLISSKTWKNSAKRLNSVRSRLNSHPGWLADSYDATSKALLYTMKRFEFDIHYPLVAELLVRFDSEDVEGEMVFSKIY